MKTRVAINGFGRIGRTVFKILMDRDDVEVVAINDLTDDKTLSHLLKYDSNYGVYSRDIGYDDSHIIVDGVKIKVFSEPEPAKIPWDKKNVDIVIESTGRFVKPELAAGHIKAGAKKVVISAPAKGEEADDVTTIVIGVNDDDLDGSGDVLSNASCTTNCVGPVAAIMHGKFGIEKAMLTTVHAYTAEQNLQDGPHKDLRRARAAALNIVPTTTGSALATAKVIPDLEGKFDGMAIRVPTAVVSLTDFTFLTKNDTTIEEINKTFQDAAEQPFYKGILDVTEDPVVSSDLVGNSHSAVVDLSLTNVVDGNLVKVVAWYDNEWGFSNRLAELVADTGRLMNQKGKV